MHLSLAIDCALVIRWRMERLSRKKCTKVLRCGSGKSTGTPPSIPGRLVKRTLYDWLNTARARPAAFSGGVGMLRGLCAQESVLLRPTAILVTLVGLPRAQGRRSTWTVSFPPRPYVRAQR